MGVIVGGAVGKVDLVFSLDSGVAGKAVSGPDIFSVVPSNIFSALSSDDTIRVLVFAAIFGLALTLCERRTGRSIFPALQSLHDACLLLFQSLNVALPIGIIALLAPQSPRSGSTSY